MSRASLPRGIRDRSPEPHAHAGGAEPPLRSAPSSARLGILIPVFNDWDSIAILLPALDRAIAAAGRTADVVLIDDGSVLPIPDGMRRQQYQALRDIDVLHLRRNLGHQRAIAVGLTYLYTQRDDLSTIVVMDGDGEDKPEDVSLLLDELSRCDGAHVVFAARTKRLENWRFQLMYRLFRLAHLWLTGVAVRVGNFSAIPASVLGKLVVVSELWNHYAAAVFRSRIPVQTLPLARGRRYCGRSQMNFSSLVLHGLSAISVFSDIVGVRLLMASGLLMAAAAVLLTGVVAIWFLTPLAIPGWATSAAGLLAVILVQSLLLMLVLSFVVLSMRSHVNMIPLLHAGVFIGSVEPITQASIAALPAGVAVRPHGLE